MSTPDFLIQLLKPWNDFYGHSKATESIVVFLHIGGILLAGGLAIAADRSTLRALRLAAAGRVEPMKELAAVHRWVITGLVIVIASGVALLASDIETFWGSPFFWIKMTLVAALLINGLIMTQTEKKLAADSSDASPHWASLRRISVTSLTLWFVITLLGAILANIA
jgi:uncharacterized membrane protein